MLLAICFVIISVQLGRLAGICSSRGVRAWPYLASAVFMSLLAGVSNYLDSDSYIFRGIAAWLGGGK